jgi:cytochrome b subunit of formate dehydrogenase
VARPEYGRWTYWEKFDYFAVFWGVAVIGSTGLFLWFPEHFTRVFPGWMINVATIIHSDEALLAVGFIFTVHFFNTHFRPEKFPIDTVVFTGGVPLEEFRRDRPREYQQMVEAGALDANLMPAPQPLAVKFWRRFGFTALSIGLSLIALIIYAALFVYR